MALDPALLLTRGAAGNAALALGRLDEAEAQYQAQRRLSSGPEAVPSIGGLALVAIARGDTAAARRLVAEMEAITDSASPHRHAASSLAAAHAALGQHDRALEWLRRYQPLRDLHFQLHLRKDPQLDPLRGDPRFQALVVEGQR